MSLTEESEFNISEFLKTPGIKLELGRACIHKDYRNGLAIGLIWQGLAKYISLTSTDLLFGCTSVDTIHPFVATALYENFKKDSVSYEFNISPKSKYKFGRIFKTIDDEPLKNNEKHIPTLLKSYLKAGAKIYSFPALDRDFKCIDFFTILKVSEMSEKYKNKFF